MFQKIFTVIGFTVTANLKQACQTQTNVRAAELDSKAKKMSKGRNLKLFKTFFQIKTHFKCLFFKAEVDFFCSRIRSTKH